MYSPKISKASAPAAKRSHSNFTPVASRMRTTASVTSGPIPSPGISVIVCVFFTALLVGGGAALGVLFPGLLFGVPAQELLQLFLELADILKVPVNAGKANIGHRIQRLQATHDQLADFGRRALSLVRFGDEAFHLVHQLFQFAGRDRPLLAGVQQ